MLPLTYEEKESYEKQILYIFKKNNANKNNKNGFK